MHWPTQVPSPMPTRWPKPIPSGVSRRVGTQYLPLRQIIGPQVFPLGFSLFIFEYFPKLLMLPQGCVDPQVQDDGQTITTWLIFTPTPPKCRLRANMAPINNTCIYYHQYWSSSLTPDVLQQIADWESLKQVVAEVIDTMTINSMRLSDHFKCVVCAGMGHRHCRPVWQNHQDQINNAIEFNMLVTTVLIAVQYHSHSDTCKKGRNGQ